MVFSQKKSLRKRKNLSWTEFRYSDGRTPILADLGLTCILISGLIVHRLKHESDPGRIPSRLLIFTSLRKAIFSVLAVHNLSKRFALPVPQNCSLGCSGRLSEFRGMIPSSSRSSKTRFKIRREVGTTGFSEPSSSSNPRC